MPPDGALRKNGKWIVQSLTPNVCLTPSGGAPVPYSCFEEGTTADSVAPTVNFTGDPAFTMQSFLSTTKNDQAGVGGGVVSGTNGGICEPIQCVVSVRACGAEVVHDRDLFWMNNRNCLALAYYEPVPIEKMKRTQLSNSEVCEPAEGQPTQEMTVEELEELQTLEQEKAMSNWEAYQRDSTLGCDDPGSAWFPHTPDPEAVACPYRHCRNNCLMTRRGNASIAEGGSDLMEWGQKKGAQLSQGYLGCTYSGDQNHDKQCSNAAGRELAQYTGESCERLCAIEMGGFKVKHGTEGPPSESYEQYRQRVERVESMWDRAKNTLDGAVETVDQAVDAVGEAADAFSEFQKKLDLIGIPHL